MDLDSMFGVFDAPAAAASAKRPAAAAAAAAAAPAAPATMADLEAELSAAKRARKKRAGGAAEADADMAPVDDTLTAEAHVISGGSKECTHEVAVPAGYKYVPLHETPFPEPDKMAKTYPFVLDAFQRESIRCIERGESVLVAAHTSAGKTVVAEYAIALSLKAGQRVIYTSPIKALSNQKYRELAEEFRDVGLLTGDTTINPSASCLIMTTEILRSMLYRGSEIMREVGWVIFDEIHYMRDAERGVVWEETIILLPHNVHYVFLSATIPNALQFAQWICHIHTQPCHVVYTDYRPTPLRHYLYAFGTNGMHLVVDEQGVFREDSCAKALRSLDATKFGRKKAAGPGNIGGQAAAAAEVFLMVKTCMERKYHPLIVFSFSKLDCELYAKKLAKLDFNNDDEKAAVDLVFMNAIEALSEEDRQLSQVQNVLPLLQKGIGIHHGGLLPIVKEVTEILFGEGLVKVLIATETFAMGLNMPARTVVFSALDKFDGTDPRPLRSGEYIQMSGRAGRRGLDDKGIVIAMLPKPFEPAVLKGILKGEADVLSSAFHLTYNMLLNLLRVEGVPPEHMLESSFFQFQNTQGIPQQEAALEELETKMAAFNFERSQSAMAYYSLLQQRATYQKSLQAIITQPAHAVPFLKPGRLVRVEEATRSWGWGMIVNFHKSRPSYHGPGAKSEPDTADNYILDVLLHCATGSESTYIPSPCTPGDRGEHLVVPVKLTLVQIMSKVCIFTPDNLKPPDARKSVWRAIEEVLQRFSDDPPLLDPVKDMNLSEPAELEVIEKLALTEERLNGHELHADEQRDALMKLCQEKEELASQISLVKRRLRDSQGIKHLEELKARKRVLRRLQFTTPEDVVELKGRVACEIKSGFELLLTEMIFHGIFNDLSMPQTVALLSCFVYEHKKKETDVTPKLEAEMQGILRETSELLKHIVKVSNEARLPADVTPSEEHTISTMLMDVVYAWVQGSKFVDICKMTKEFEGTIIRCIRRLDELLREMVSAAKAIGNSELENKFAEGITAIRRDIIFAASLYL